MDNDDKFTIEGDDEDEDPIFKHDEAIERYLKNPDSVIADFTGHRFVFKVTSGYITDDSIAERLSGVQQLITSIHFTE